MEEEKKNNEHPPGLFIYFALVSNVTISIDHSAFEGLQKTYKTLIKPHQQLAHATMMQVCTISVRN